GRRPLDRDILMDTDPERTNPERLCRGTPLGPSHVEIREDDPAKFLMECVDVAPEVGVVEGQFPLGAVQLHPDPLEVSRRRFRAHGVGRPALVFPGKVVDVPESGAGIVVESPVGASVGPGHAHPPVGQPAQVHFPPPGGNTHLIVPGDGFVGAAHGPEILGLIPQGRFHVRQLGLRGGDALRT
ncbi:hypothetical protein N302_05932, partial [Corvus brachyrhynchos]